MQVLLDTSVVIDATELDLSDWEQSGPMISAVTLAELYSGVEVGDAIERAGRRGRVNLARSSYRILPFGEDEAEAYGLLSTLLRELGRQRRRRALDLQIAATAMVYRVPLLTRNARDLVGLERVVKVVAV